MQKITSKPFASADARVRTVPKPLHLFRFWAWIACILMLIVIVVLNSIGDIRLSPFVELVAMNRLVTCVGLLGVTVAFLFLARVWRARSVAVVAAITVLVSAAGVTTTFVSPPREHPSVSGVDLRILEWNTNQDGIDANDIEDLVAATSPDVIVLPELFDVVAEGSLANLLAPDRYSLLSWESSTSSILVSADLGEYEVDFAGVPAWAGFVARPVDRDSQSPTFVVAHVEHVGFLHSAVWNEHMDWVASACDGPNVIAVGDFNASAHNLPRDARLGSCADVAVTLGETSSGTWPSWLPAELGAQIDRVLVGDAWKATHLEVLTHTPRGQSDHRPLLVDLKRVAD